MNASTPVDSLACCGGSGEGCWYCEELSHWFTCDCVCCRDCEDRPVSDRCGRPVHGCLIWVDDRDHPKWFDAVDDEYQRPICGPCREVA